MSEQTNLEVVKEAYAAFGRGDITALLAGVDPNPDWEFAGPKDISWAGSFHDYDGVKKFFAAIAGDAEFDAFEPQTFVAQGDRVVVLGFERVRIKRTGRTYESHWAMAFTLAGGRITKFREYTDTATIAAAFRKG
jgi:uncharacterized protein